MDLSAFKQTVSANSNVVVANITVTGTTTTVNSTDLLIQDNKVLLNSGTPYPLLDASVMVDRGSSPDTSITWSESLQKWQQTRDGATFVDIPINTGELREDPANLYFTTDRANSAIANFTGNLNAGNASLGNIVTANYIVGNVSYNNITQLPLLRLTFNYNDASPSLVGLVPANAVISRIEIIISTAFNDRNSSLTLGTITHPNELIDTIDTNTNVVGLYTVIPGTMYMSDTHLLLTINPGSSTTGSGMLIIYY